MIVRGRTCVLNRSIVETGLFSWIRGGSYTDLLCLTHLRIARAFGTKTTSCWVGLDRVGLDMNWHLPDTLAVNKDRIFFFVRCIYRMWLK